MNYSTDLLKQRLKELRYNYTLPDAKKDLILKQAKILKNAIKVLEDADYTLPEPTTLENVQETLL